jgi:hypothetical protein
VQTIVPRLIAACIAFSAAANVVHAQAEKPKPWVKKFTMSREECTQKMLTRRGMHPRGFSNLRTDHDFSSHAPGWAWKCTERYGHL